MQRHHRIGAALVHESASTPNKSLVGGGLKARNSNAQTREAMIGCHVLNRMAELGRPESLRSFSHRLA